MLACKYTITNNNQTCITTRKGKKFHNISLSTHNRFVRVYSGNWDYIGSCKIYPEFRVYTIRKDKLK